MCLVLISSISNSRDVINYGISVEMVGLVIRKLLIVFFGMILILTLGWDKVCVSLYGKKSV